MNSFQGAWETPEYRKSVLNSTNGLYVCASGIDIMHSLQSNIIRSRPHGRDDYQIIYIQQGCCYYLDRDNRTKKAESNSIILFKPHEPQIYQYKMNDETTAYWTHFNGSSKRSRRLILILDVILLKALRKNIYLLPQIL